MPQITVLKSGVSTPAGKKYEVCEMGYKTDDGKVKSMRIFGFGQWLPIFDVARNTSPGDVMEASFRQNDKGYWEFATLVPTGQKASVAAAAPAAPAKGNWETSDERAQRQVMIVRQSSLSTAVAMFEANKAKATPEDVIKVASQFEAFVMGKDSDSAPDGDVE